MLKVSMESALRAGLEASLHRPIEQASQNCKSSLQVRMLSLLLLTVAVGIWVDIQLEHLPGPVMSALDTCELASGQTQASNRVIVELEPASTIVSLAGLFLGYPCTYCNCSTNQILSGPLKVVQVDLLHLTQSEKLQHFLPSRHQLMAFSFPAVFDYPGSNLELDKLIERLKHQIQDRLRSAGRAYGWEEVEIRVEQTVHLERVAL
ncbi:hypothetical protein Pst134EA_017172 [Puccinia striiformis f. sp. tritici]|uniref:hypothetical protein n=1 Tax=Puccinia striiformis f. sp. tritici TaxID=168172 RepID=UPI002007E05A|nr:hypothetical protein Pst134EA_017172 [Puccinia striiformis f. sp. tritici]KAH9460858.1 hypothetical protein Pst134EA_017172 [Puccinia striiformis f. sp. tritici]